MLLHDTAELAPMCCLINIFFANVNFRHRVNSSKQKLVDFVDCQLFFKAFHQAFIIRCCTMSQSYWGSWFESTNLWSELFSTDFWTRTRLEQLAKRRIGQLSFDETSPSPKNLPPHARLIFFGRKSRTEIFFRSRKSRNGDLLRGCFIRRHLWPQPKPQRPLRQPRPRSRSAPVSNWLFFYSGLKLRMKRFLFPDNFVVNILANILEEEKKIRGRFFEGKLKLTPTKFVHCLF